MEQEKMHISHTPETPAVQPEATGTAVVNVGKTERILSLIGGAALLFLTRNRSKVLGTAMAFAGGALLYRGGTGYCPVNEISGRDTAVGEKPEPVNITRSLTIDKPRAEVYAFWRKLENLPRFMKHLSKVREITPTQSHWESPVPGTSAVLKWNAEIIEDKPGVVLSWKSLKGATVDNAGEVRFYDAPGNRGTEVHVSISYVPPAGMVGSGLSHLLNPVFSQMVKEDIRRFKTLIETGEIPTIEGQSSGRDKLSETIKTDETSLINQIIDQNESPVLERY